MKDLPPIFAENIEFRTQKGKVDVSIELITITER